MKPKSREAIEAVDATGSKGKVIILAIITHQDMPEPLLIAGDNPDLINASHPRTRGVWSRWRSPDGQRHAFLFVGMSIQKPDMEAEAEPRAKLQLIVTDDELVDLLLDNPVKATCRLAVVMKSTPDLVEFETSEMLMENVAGDFGALEIVFSKKALYGEPYPHQRMSKQILPALFR